ncbi:MAG TPA: hypothetical protein VD996_04525 [Chitinophagaceae bacterium]|nr:hypothetical protein [Chitinophagaceae bacterium]
MNKLYLFALSAVTTITIASCGASAVSSGDKVDLDKFSFTASYRDLPRRALDTSFHTFSVKVDHGLVTRLAMRKSEMEDQVMIEGWRRLPYDAHIHINIKFEDIIVQGSEVKEKVEILKDKSGKETGKRITYTLEVAYSFGAHAKITDYKGNLVDNVTLASRDQRRVHHSDPFPSAAEANAYAKYGLILLIPQLTKQSMNNAIANLNNSLTQDYGYPERTVSDHFWIVASRKHPEYENHRRAWATFRQAITQMSPDEPLDEVKRMMQPVIDYYNKVTKIYTSDSKGDKKMRYASHYNLAKIYWYLDDPDAALREANELIINGYDARDGHRLEAGATELKTLMRQSRMYSRHFRVRVHDYQGPDMAGSE